MEPILASRIRELGLIEPRRTAVLAVHWQVDVISPHGVFGRVFAPAVEASGIVPRTKSLLAAARRAGALVVYVNVLYFPGYVGHIRNNALFNAVVDATSGLAADRPATTGGFIRGTPGVEVVPELKPEPGDITVEHSRISAFFGNDLTTMLIGHGIETVIVTGVATNVAIDLTVRDAVQLGYRTILAEDCCCSSSPDYHEAALKTLRVLATGIAKADELIAAFDDNVARSKPAV